MATDTAINQAYLSSFFNINESILQTLITSPTTQLITTFLQSAARKAEEHEFLKAEKLQADVELENVVRTSETKLKAQKSTVTRQAKEIEELRQKVNEIEATREQLTNQLGNLQTNASDSSTETQALRNRIASLEASNRDTLAILENRSSEKDRVYKDLEEQHSKAVDLRREVSKLEELNHALENQVSSQKFKEQSLKQELELVKKNNDWQANEIKITSADHAKFRKERNARLSTLQRELDDASSLVDTLRQTETSLRLRLDDLQAKLDDAFTKNANIQEAAAQAEQSFRSQLDSTKRLAELHAQSAATHKARLEEVQSQVERLRDDAAEEIGRLQTEIETERADKIQAEHTIARLELQLEKHDKPSIPGTPMNGVVASPSLLGSAQKAVRNMTTTQLYSQYIEAKQDLELEERRTAKLQGALDDLIQEMESRAPELLELKQEQDRLEAEIVNFSQMLDEANETRDAAVLRLKEAELEGAANLRESDILRQQLRDMSAQVKILLVELQAKEQGLEDMSVQERLELERAARGDLDGKAIEYNNSTQQLISERLVIFRGVSELQSRNEQLLRLTRDLGDKMEGEEAREKARQSAADATEVHELRAQLARYKDEMHSTTVQIDSYMKERDMFRRMLQHRGTIAPDTDMQAMFGSSMIPATPQRSGIEPATPRSKDAEDLNKLLKEQQKFFDEYRNESATDRRMLKDQVDALAREKSTLQLEIARGQSQLTLAADRLDLLQTNFASLRNENMELQKRSQILSENAAKQDLRTQQVAEELVEARSLADSLRAENANTKAEKDLWKRIETRLTEENNNLMDERTRLSKLNTDLSNLANERERTENEARRRLQGRSEALENELSELKRKLDEEVDSSKKTVLRREYEESQNRTRIDDLAKSLSYAREELASAKTARDQLQSRVDEMKIELRAAEEKAVALQPRPTARSNGILDDDLSTEQRLGVQLSDTKRDLDLARSELDSAREQIEQYKAIAQSTEEELANFNQTTEQYREEADALTAEKEATITQLNGRIEDLTAELSTTNEELSDLRTKHDNASQDLAAQRATLEAELARLTDDAERHAEEKRLYQEDIKAQAEIARQALSNYDTELIKHAEATANLQKVRQELNTLRTEVAGIRADAEAAKVSLESGQESWSEQQDGLQREITELTRRRNDVDAQNKLLHQQLETFSAELQALRQSRVQSQADIEPSSNDTTDNLQGLITYLRREKEIIEVQHELAVQESRRLQQQLDYANGQVDDLHVKLSEERKQSSDRANSEASTTKLAQTINELNLFRESSVTLRNEARQARERLEEKIKEVEKLQAELQPLHARLGELEADVEVKDSEIKLITNDRDHWRDRTQKIISQYDRVDPAELEELRSRIDALQAEKEQVMAEQIPLREQIEEAEKRAADAQTTAAERLERFKDQAKNKAREQNARYSELKGELTTAQEEQARLTAELESTKLETQQPAQQEGLSNEESETLRSRIAEADAQVNVRAVEVEALQTRVKELEQQVEVLTSELTKAQASSSPEEQGEIIENDQLEKAQQELSDARQEISRLQTERIESNVESGDSDVAAEIAKLRSEMEQQHELAMTQVREAADTKINNMKTNLQRQLRETRDKIAEDARTDLITQHSTEIQTIRDEYEQTITKLKQEHSAELERLKNDGDKVLQKSIEPTDEEINELMKTNARVRSVMQNSVRKNVSKETEKLSAALAAKDVEIAQLKEGKSEVVDAGTLEAALATAKQEKDAAVRTAIDNAEKKAKVQLSQRDLAQAKLAVVSKAAQDTPTRAVSEVWEDAKKARPTPKPAVAVAAPPATSAAPENAEDEAARLQARKERFGNASAGQGLFGKAEQPSGSFGQPSGDATAPNPEAAAFVPGTATRAGSSIPTANRGGRGGGAAGNLSIQGAASRGGPTNIARGAFSGRARGTAAGNGLKRQHEGSEGGVGKKPRGG